MSKNTDKQIIGLCGLDCWDCPTYLATIKDDDSLREKTANEWNERYRTEGYNRPLLTSTDINCLGCLSQTVFLYCRKCLIRACGLEKGITNCGECEEYRCDKLIELHNKIPRGKEVCDKIKKYHPE